MPWLEKLLVKTGDKRSKNLILNHQSSFGALKTGADMIEKAKQHFKKQQIGKVRLHLPPNSRLTATSANSKVYRKAPLYNSITGLLRGALRILFFLLYATGFLIPATVTFFE